MKKIITILSSVALVVMGASTTSCDKIENESPYRINPDGSVTYTVTVNLPEGTKSLSPVTGDVLQKTFGTGERIKLTYGDSNTIVSEPLTTSDLRNNQRSATFTFTFATVPDLPVKTAIKYEYPAAHTGLDGQDGTLDKIESHFDYAKWEGKVEVAGVLPTPPGPLDNQYAICKFTLKNSETNINETLTQLTISDGTNTYTITPPSTETYFYSTIWVAMQPFSDKTITITATDGSKYYINANHLTGKTLAVGKFYTIDVTMQESNTVDLSKIHTNFTAQNGQTLTGTLGSNVKISIADGAAVTLDNATINGVNDLDYRWAGITCLGDATITLSGTNTVKGFEEDSPGIQAGPSGKMLTIQGTGSLTASSNGNGIGIGGYTCGDITITGGTITANGGSNSAGIGGGTCGKITISGGTITATGGQYGAGIGCGKDGTCTGGIEIGGTATVTATGGARAAGIGSGHGNMGDSNCGNITIGGTATVSATGGHYGAGIGSGKGIENIAWKSNCGNITISNTVTRVTATKGADAQNSIGKGDETYSTCGTVTIGGNPGAITTSPYTYPSLLLSGKFTINGSDGKVQFSRGNLKRVDGTWSFHTNQYDYLGTWSSTSCDLFYWETTGNYGSEQNCVTSSGTSSDVANWGTNMGSGWKTLTKDEWVYLFANHTKGWASVNGVGGYVIRPDGVSTAVSSSYTASEWATEEAAGSVFLPASGNRDNWGVNSPGIDGYYWSSSPNGADKAYCVQFYSSYLNAEFNNQNRINGCAVRLVKDAN